MKTLSFVLSLFIFISIGDAKASPDLKKIFQHLNRVTETSLPKIWPTLEWQNAEIVYFDRQTKKAWIWKKEISNDLPELVDYSIVPLNVTNSGYGVDYRQDSKAFRLFINLNENDTFEDALDLSFHEGFHFFHQLSSHHMWHIPSHDRNIDYPVPVKPRYLRKMLTKMLFEACMTTSQTERDVKLKQATDLWRRWKEEAPEEVEAARSVEIMEGAAMYVATMSMHFATGESIQSYISKNAKFMIPFGSLETESYDLGHYASLLLDSTKLVGWKDRVSKGESPVTILLQDKDSIPAPHDKELLSGLENFFESQSKDLESTLKPSIEILKNGDFIKLAVPQSITHGSAGSYEGRFRLTEFDNTVITLRNNILYQNDQSTFKLENVSTYEEETNPCSSEPSIVVLMPKNQFENALSESRLDIVNEEMTLKFNGRLEGQYFCGNL